jgi:hypothetical protein
VLCRQSGNSGQESVFIFFSFQKAVQLLSLSVAAPLQGALAYRGGGVGVFKPPPKFRSFTKLNRIAN